MVIKMILKKIFFKKCPNCKSKMTFITKRKMMADDKYIIKVFLCKSCGNTYKKVIN